MRNVGIYWVRVPNSIQLGDIDKASIYLDSYELQTYRNYKTTSKKVEYLTGRVLIKTIISNISHIPLGEVRFKMGEFGKPFLDYRTHYALDKKIEFNLSHTKHMIACAITTEKNVGIDVEEMCAEHLNIMDYVFTQAEYSYINSGELCRTYAFYQTWTRKEAYVKAIGRGFSIPPKSFSVPGGTNQEVYDNIEYFTLKLLDSYVLSVAIEKGSEEFNYQVYEVDFRNLYHQIQCIP